MAKELNSRQWKIYNFLKRNCVGKNNQMKAKDIISSLQKSDSDLFNDKYIVENFRKDLRTIRQSDVITRLIGSNRKGYWMMLKGEENGLTYMKSQIATHIKTCVKSGIPVAYFHQIINNIEETIVTDNQQKITFSPYERCEIKKYSDDLVEVQ